MTTPTISHQHSAAPSWKVAALIACALALGLLAWRGQAVFAASASDGSSDNTAYSSSELTLFNIVEPIVGAENVRVAVTPFADGSRVVTILLNEPANGQRAQVHELAMRALSIQAARGDKLSVDVAAFSSPDGSALSYTEYFELCGLALLAALTAWIGLRPRQGTNHSASPLQARSISDVSRPAELVIPQQTVAPEIDDPLSNAAKSDPAGVARVLRGWMTQEEAS